MTNGIREKQTGISHRTSQAFFSKTIEKKKRVTVSRDIFKDPPVYWRLTFR